MWLDMLKTPMAAPETPALKVLRLSILVMAALLVATILALAPLRAAIGNGAGSIAGVLLASLALLVPVYVIRKNRADEAFVDAMLAARPDAESVS